MRLKNSTTLPDALVRDILRFVCPSGVTGYDIRLGITKTGTPFKGRAYTNGCAYHDRRNVPLITAYVAPAERYPYRPIEQRHRGGYLPTPALGTQVEAVVYLLAHEMRHLWQALIPRGRRVWGARGQFSERDADAYAIQTLRRWRRESPSVLSL